MHLSETKVYMGSTKPLEDEKVFHKWYQSVSMERQEKIDRLRFQEDKRLSLAAAVLLKKVLEQHGITDYELASDENGKPYLLGMGFLKFNLSHSGERVMCVISDQDAGCDVERIRHTDYKVASRFFTEEERRFLEERTGEGEKKDAFYRLWTLKESFMKAVGLGMKLSLTDFSFSFQEDKVSVCQNVNGEEYYFKEYDLMDGYKYAVCSLNPVFADIQEIEL